MKHWIRSLIDGATCGDQFDKQYTQKGLRRLIELVETLDTHLFSTDELEEIADELTDCGKLDELGRIMWNATTSSGFEHFAVFAVNCGSSCIMRSRICTSYNESWIAQYLDRGYQSIDPVWNAAREKLEPFRFDELPNASPEVRKFWTDAERHRIGRNGVCFTFQRSHGMRIGVSFCTAKSVQQCRTLLDRYGSDLMVVSELATDAFIRGATTNGGTGEDLSIEELRFLHKLVTCPDPHVAMSMPARFGSNKGLQASIRRKLGVRTVFQAIKIASARGMIDCFPYEVSSTFSEPRPALASFDEIIGCSTAGEGDRNDSSYVNSSQ